MAVKFFKVELPPAYGGRLFERGTYCYILLFLRCLWGQELLFDTGQLSGHLL